MKRGQLAAVLIIVLLVAAVGGFYIFSEKRAGQATRTLSGAKPLYTVIGEPIVGQTQSYPPQPSYPPQQPYVPPTQPQPTQAPQPYYPPSSSPQPAGTASTGAQQPPVVMADIPPLGWGSAKDIETALANKFAGDLAEDFARMLRRIALGEYERCSKICYVPYYDCCYKKKTQYEDCMKATRGAYNACLYGCSAKEESFSGYSCPENCKKGWIEGCKKELTTFCDKEGAYDDWLKCIKDNKCDVIKNLGFNAADFRPDCTDLNIK